MKISKYTWCGFLALVGAGFVVLEGAAIHQGGPTLSYTIWAATASFPFIAFLAGAFFGGLAVHLWWLPKTDKGF